MKLPLPQSLKVLGVVFVHSNRCVLVSCVVLTGLSLMTQRRNLSYAYLPLFIFFSEVSVRIFCSFFNWVGFYFWILRVLFIFWLPVLYHTGFADTGDP